MSMSYRIFILNLFKAENWAVFSVHLPDISFSTDVYCETNEETLKENCVIYQHFIFNVGRAFENELNFHDDQNLGASIIRVTKTRARRRPGTKIYIKPKFIFYKGAQADVKEWVTYAVPKIDQNNPEKTKDEDIHVIFAIPQTELTLKTEQEQELRLPVFPDDVKVSRNLIIQVLYFYSGSSHRSLKIVYC